jgi:hypothetical protein
MAANGLTRTLIVDGGATSSTQDGTLSNPYHSIQAAVELVNASVAEVVAEFPRGRGGAADVPIPRTVADSVQDWTILIAPGDYDEDLAISGPVRLALIGLGAFRLGRYTSLGTTQPGQTNIVAEDGATRNLVWSYAHDQAIQDGAAPQLVIGTIGGTDVYRHGKPIANRISGSIIVQGGGWTSENTPAGGTAFLAIANTQVDAGITKSPPAQPKQPAIDMIGSAFRHLPRFDALAPFSGILVDRHFNSRFRGEILGRLNPKAGKPPGYVLAASVMSQYEQPVKVSGYGSIQQAAFAAGMTVSQVPQLFKLGVPPGMVNSTFAGEFKFEFEAELLGPGDPVPSPEESLLLDSVTNTWFTRNGATLAGGATKSLL